MTINIDKVQSGMILDENIYRGDQLVISQGVEINQRHIEMMRRLDVQHIKILENDPLSFSPERQMAARYKASYEKFKSICHSVTVGGVVLYDEVKSCMDPLLEEIENNPQMAVKLWQIETADFYTYEHSVKVCMLSILMAKWLGKPQAYYKEIGTTGLLHDIGKCNIPNEILNKPDVLTSEEFSVMKTHATLGYVLLTMTKELSSNVLKGVLHHHERYDGQGYPAGLAGDEIPEYAKIVSIVDVFDAMTSNRVYRDKMNPYRVFEIMKDGMKGALDPALTKFFIERLKHFFVGEQVVLNTGAVAVIHSVDTPLAYRPVLDIGGHLVDLTDNIEIEIKSLVI